MRSRVSEALAAHLQAQYVFPEMAERLGREVAEHHAAGRYAAVTSALELAKALTAELQATSGDKHLGVSFRPEPRGGAGGGGASAIPFEPPRNGMIRQLQVLDGNIGYLQSDGASFAQPVMHELSGAVHGSCVRACRRAGASRRR